MQPKQSNEQQNEGEIESLDFEKPDYVFKPKEHHEWRQQGPYLVCKSCELQHAIYVGMERVLIGLNDQGQPLFKSRSLEPGV